MNEKIMPNLEDQNSPTSESEKTPEQENAHTLVDDFFDAYRAKYEGSDTLETNVKKYMDMMENGNYAGVKKFLEGALNKYTKMQDYEKAADQEGKEAAIDSYENMAAKATAAINAFEVLL